MVFASIAQLKQENQKASLANPEEGFLVGDTFHPPSERENPDLALEAITTSPGFRYKPIKVRQELLLNYLIDGFIPEDKPEKLIEFINRLKLCHPDLAVKILMRILPEADKPTQQPTTNNIQINQPAPVILIRPSSEQFPTNEITAAPETDQTAIENTF